MKRLHSMFKKSPSLRDSLVCTGLLTVLAVGCTLHYGYPRFFFPNPSYEPSVPAETGQNVPSSPQASEPPPSEVPTSAVSLSILPASGEKPLVQWSGMGCPNNEQQQWHFQFSSLERAHLLQASLRGNGDEFEIDQKERFPLGAEAKAALVDLRKEICQQWEQAERPSTLRIDDKTTTEKLRGFLASTLGPDCKITWSAERGWNCQLPDLDLNEASLALQKLQALLLRNWARQPYLIARRLTLSQNLLEALQSEPKSAMPSVCMIIVNSLPMEVPLAFTSKAWQKAVCPKKKADKEPKIQEASIGLLKAINEIDFAIALADVISSQGQLEVKVPEDNLQSKDIWVNLKPQDDVWQRVLATALDLDPNTAPAVPKIPRCWHPLFHDSPTQMSLATLMGLTGSRTFSLCQKEMTPSSKEELTSLASYLGSTIMSETDFVMANGRFKVLRLPQGHYEYVLANSSEAASSSSASSKSKDERVSGTIGWTSKNPRLAIKQW